MNVLDAKKARHLCSLFSYGHGIRESARLAEVNRGTSARHYRAWLAVRSQLQIAYDALWDGDDKTCDAINEPLPGPAVEAMLNAWLDDQSDDCPKSGWHAGYPADLP